MTLFSVHCGRGAERSRPLAQASEKNTVIVSDSGGGIVGKVESRKSGDGGAEASAPVLRAFTVPRIRAFEAAPTADKCKEVVKDEDAMVCALEDAFAGDSAASLLALDLFRSRGDFVGVEEEQMMDGGFRGNIRLIPMLPKGKHRKQLEWVAASLRDFDRFMTGISKGEPPAYRLSGLLFRFLESVGRTTPSAYASSWRIGYNVNGSLLKNEDGVRETLFHEIFHLNDEAHGDWSVKTLSAVHGEITKKCGTDVACLAPFAPNSTKVRGGTYYAFQPNNGVPVREYGAELAVRYYREMRGELGHAAVVRPRFKCGPPQNRLAWEHFTREFFRGVDLGPDC